MKNKKLNFMVVDDSKVIRDQIKTILEAKEYELISCAEDGLDALRQFKNFKPNIVTMDLTMPKVEGVETIRRMTSLDPNVRILVISAVKDKVTALEALRMGAYGFISKPFSKEQLTDAIEKLVLNIESTRVVE